MKEIGDGESSTALRPSEKLLRDHQHHLGTPPPFGGISLLNTSALGVFRADPGAMFASHIFASLAASGSNGRFGIPIQVPSQTGPLFSPPTAPATNFDFLTSWVKDQGGDGEMNKEIIDVGWEEKLKTTNRANKRPKKDFGKIQKEEKKVSATINSPPNHNNNNNNNNVNNVAREKVFICHICSRCFGYKHVLQNHERTHTGEKPFECNICQKKFTRDHHLKTHMRLHTGEKPFHCSHCDRQFVQVANLRRHLRVHTGERPYACGLCASRFSDSNQLKAHMLIHRGEKPYGCEECGCRFRRRHHLAHHKCKEGKTEDSPPTPGTKRERKPRETRRIIRIDGMPVPAGFLALPEQTHPEDLSINGSGLRSRSLSGTSCSASPSPTSGGSEGVYSRSTTSSDPPECSSDEEAAIIQTPLP